MIICHFQERLVEFTMAQYCGKTRRKRVASRRSLWKLSQVGCAVQYPFVKVVTFLRSLLLWHFWGLCCCVHCCVLCCCDISEASVVVTFLRPLLLWHFWGLCCCDISEASVVVTFLRSLLLCPLLCPLLLWHFWGLCCCDISEVSVVSCIVCVCVCVWEREWECQFKKKNQIQASKCVKPVSKTVWK